MKPFFASTLLLSTRVLSVHSKEIEPCSEVIILLFDFVKRITPFCRSAYLADLTGLGAARIVGSWSRYTPSIGQSQNLQGARNVLLVCLTLDSPLSHPKIRTSSFAVSHTRLAALPWGPRLSIGRRRRGLHQRRSGLDSRQRWRSRKRPQREKRLPLHATPSRTRRVSNRGVAEGGFGATFVGVDSFEATFGGVLVHLTVSQILYLFLTNNFDLMWVQWSTLDIVLRFPLLLKFFVRIHRKNVQLRQKWATLRLVLRRGGTQVRL